MNGYGNGAPNASENLLIATGLYATGKTELAKEIARRFCDGMKLGRSPFFGIVPGFSGSWGAAGFQILANLVCNMSMAPVRCFPLSQNMEWAEASLTERVLLPIPC